MFSVSDGLACTLSLTPPVPPVGHNGLSYDRIDLNTIKDLLGLNPVSAPGGPGVSPI